MTTVALPHWQEQYFLKSEGGVRCILFGRSRDDIPPIGFNLRRERWNGKCIDKKDVFGQWGIARNFVARAAVQAGVSTIYTTDPIDAHRSIIDPTQASFALERSSATGIVKILLTNLQRMVSVTRCGCYEGTVVPRGSAGYLFSADCPIVVFYSPIEDRLVIVHAGRSSLLPTKKEFEANTTVEPSVVNNALDSFCDPTSVRVATLLSVDGAYFRHSPDNPVHGEYNRQLLGLLSRDSVYRGFPCVTNDCGISLHYVVAAQACARGVLPQNIVSDGVNTATSEHWYSRIGGDRGLNNGVLVVHN